VPILVILLLGATWPERQVRDYLSAGAPRLVSGASERIQQREQTTQTAAALALGSFVVTAVFAYSFVKFDRKQNTRLWPFVTTGTARSPPFCF
jgi:hypothetical protein